MANANANLPCAELQALKTEIERLLGEIRALDHLTDGAAIEKKAALVSDAMEAMCLLTTRLSEFAGLTAH